MPLRPFHPQYRAATLLLKEDPLSERPDLAVGVARCLAAWARVELALSGLFVNLVNENREIGASLWNSFNSDKSKIDALNSLCAARTKGDDYLFVIGMLKMVRAFGKTRHKLAHWIWMYSDQIKDGLPIVDPKTLLLTQGKLQDALQRKQKVTPRHWSLPNDEVYVCTISDVEIDIRDFGRTERVVDMVGILVSNQGKEELEYTRHGLVINAHLAPFLSPSPSPDPRTD